VNSLIRAEVDVDGEFVRSMSAFEKRQVPFAAMQAINATAFETRQRWAEIMPRIFDRPTSLTLKAVLYTKATLARLFAEVFIRDEAFKGTAPAKYLRAQVEGGERRPKGIERQLNAAGLLPAGMFVVPGQGASLDAHGNLPLSQLNAIKAQIGAHADPTSNESSVSRARRKKRQAKQGRRGGNYFALSRAHGKLAPGIYERVTTGFGSAVRSVLFFVKKVQYRKRFDIFGIARKVYDRRFPDNFKREFARAVTSTKVR